jgi:hypothetical protein
MTDLYERDPGFGLTSKKSDEGDVNGSDRLANDRYFFVKSLTSCSILWASMGLER